MGFELASVYILNVSAEGCVFDWSVDMSLFKILFVAGVSSVAAVSYPVQEFRLGIGNSDRSMTGVAAGSYVSSATFLGTKSQKWHLNYVSAGIHEIVNSETGQLLTNDGGLAVTAADKDAENQRWLIRAVENDFDGYALYYKVVCASDSSLGLTFYPNSNSFRVESYTGAAYQKFKLNLDGLEGYAANALTPSGQKAGTIGGLLGEVVYVSTADDLETQLNSVGAQTIVITADIDMQKKSNTRVRDNKTIVGQYGNHTIYDSQFRTNDAWGTAGEVPSDNIVFRNLKMVAKNAPNRILINIWSSRQIWIDHVYFESQLSYDRTGNGQDEVGKFIWINTPYANYMDSLDRYRSPDYVTISYSHLKNRYWTVAYGTQNDEISRDRTTLLFNWWDKNVRRCPQLGNGSAHIYNNYFSAYGTSSNGSATSGIIGGDGSDMVSIGNRFNGYTKSQALMMGGGTDPSRDSYSYLSESLDGTPSPVSFSPKVSSSWKPEETNYGYSLIDAYNSKGTDVKDFCTKYTGDQTTADGMKYVTDGDFENWVTVTFPSPFLESISVGMDPVNGKTAATMDAKHSVSIRNVNSGLYLSPGNAQVQNGTDVEQSGMATAWTLTLSEEDGYYYLNPEGSELFLAAEGASSLNGTNISVREKSAADAFLFKFVLGDDGTFNLTTEISADKSCLGVAAGSKDSGATVVEWECNGSDDQKWVVTSRPNVKQGTLFADLKVYDLERDSAWNILSEVGVGSLIFGDRDVTFADIPDSLVGAELISPACDSKKFTSDTLATFTAAKKMTVYVAVDSRLTAIPDWLSSWTKTDLTVTNSANVIFDVYALSASAGEVVFLGSNGQTGGCVQYFVLGVPEKTTALVEQKPFGGFSARFDGDVFLVENRSASTASVSLHRLSGERIAGFSVDGRNAGSVRLGGATPRGVYFVRVRTASGNATFRVVRQ